MKTGLAWLVICGWIVAMVGCGESGIYKVKGIVTFEGKPVPNGTVNYIPDSGGPSASGELKPDGSYELTTNEPSDGAMPGKYKVVIVAMENQDGKLPEERSPLPAAIVPDRYTSLVTSPLTANVEAKENKIDFDLTKKP